MQLNCVVTSSYTLGFLMTKNSWLVFWMKHKISKQNIIVFSFMEKMLVIQFHSMEKCLSCTFHTIFGIKRLTKKLKFQFQSMEKMFVIKFHSMEKMPILLLSDTYFCYMKLYERV